MQVAKNDEEKTSYSMDTQIHNRAKKMDLKWEKGAEVLELALLLRLVLMGKISVPYSGGT